MGTARLAYAAITPDGKSYAAVLVPAGDTDAVFDAFPTCDGRLPVDSTSAGQGSVKRSGSDDAPAEGRTCAWP